MEIFPSCYYSTFSLKEKKCRCLFKAGRQGLRKSCSVIILQEQASVCFLLDSLIIKPTYSAFINAVICRVHLKAGTYRELISNKRLCCFFADFEMSWESQCLRDGLWGFDFLMKGMVVVNRTCPWNEWVMRENKVPSPASLWGGMG